MSDYNNHFDVERMADDNMSQQLNGLDVDDDYEAQSNVSILRRQVKQLVDELASLQEDLTTERARTDTLAQALEEIENIVGTGNVSISSELSFVRVNAAKISRVINNALSDWRTARGAK